MSKNATNAVLVATLGSEPQIIPIAFQLLRDSGEAIQTVVVLHTFPHHEPIRSALSALQEAFTGRENWPALETTLIPAADVLTATELERFSETLFQALKKCLAQDRRVHLLLAGGRKPMAMLGMTIAQMLLGPGDRVWYLHSDEALRASGRYLLEPGDQTRLIPIPLPNLSTAPATFTRLMQAGTPQAALAELNAAQMRRRRHFLQVELTPAEREVAALIATEVLTVREMARRLHKSPKTVTNQLTSVYSKLESYFGLQPDVGIKREFLRRELRDYFNELGR